MRYWTLIPAALLIGAGVLLAKLPAAVIKHFIPPFVQLGDLSGTIWHGVAGRIAIGGSSAGAVEWRLHPLDLIRGTADVDAHWVDHRISLRANARISPGGLSADAIRGTVPITDLAAFGVAPGWRGTAHLDLSHLQTDYTRIESIEGSLRLSQLSSSLIAGGAPLGDYLLRFDGGAAMRARVRDTGGPLRLRATATIDSSTGRGTISGTLRARAGAAPALASVVDQMAQLRGRDATGAVPVDLEFTY